jgi:hypothetical protein
MDHKNSDFKLIGLIPCAGTASRLYNIPKFILPLKDKNCSLFTNWCNILLHNKCDKIIIGSSVNNKPFIEHILSTQFESTDSSKIIIKIIHNSPTMNNTILEMLKDENYDMAIMGMPDTHVDSISPHLIQKLYSDSNNSVGAYLWNIRLSQIGKIGQCKIDDNYICDIIDKNKSCDYNYGWGSIVFKPEFEKFILKDDLHLGYSLKTAIQNKSNILYEIVSGQYWDCGTIDEYKDYMQFLDNKKPIYIKGDLIIISVYITSDPTKYDTLIKCLTQLRHIYKTETIVAVDNNSINTDWYSIAKSLNMYVITNKSDMYRYEIGAYNLALKHFRAERYICIQGTIFFHKKIEEKLDNQSSDMYAFGVITNNLSWTEEGRSIINKYLNFMNMKNWNNDPLLLWNSFYCNDICMQNLLNSGLLDLVSNSKDISCAYERILGCYFSRLNNNHIKSIDKNTFTKYFLNQI